MKTLKELVTISPLLGAFLIFLGMLKLVVYYSLFHISITEYIQLSEVITSFMMDLNIIVVLFIFLVFHIFLTAKYIESLNINLFSSQRFVHKLINTKKGFLFSLSIPIILYIFFLKYPNIILVYFIVIFLFNPLISITRWLTKRNRISDNVMFAVQVVSLSVLFTINLSLKDYLNMKKELQKATIDLTDNSINLTENEKIIGKTNEYLFIVNIQNCKTQVIPCREIKRIVFNN